MNLFDYMGEVKKETESPLASRLRPTTLEEVVGQQHIIGKGKLLYRAIKADKLSYLTNDVLENSIVKVFDEKTMEMVETPMYNEEKLSGNDAYDLFLSGAVPLVTIENPNAKREKELYIFRDSYGSSLAPLIVEGYSKITLIDLRYIASNLLTNFIEFKEGSDALFIYCVDVFNNSTMLKVF